MFDEFYTGVLLGGRDLTPALPTLAGFGYDKHRYISTANLSPTAYTNQSAIAARYGSVADLVQATDDGTGPDQGASILAQIIANVTTDINGLISTIYPIPLAKTGTVAVIRVTGVSTDGLGTITSIEIVEIGNYATAPASANTPAYLRQINSDDEQWVWLCNQQQGTGAIFAVTFTDGSPVFVAGSGATPKVVSGTPTITNGGANYQCEDLLVLTGGSSFVPDKITNAATLLCCYEAQRRRITPNEQNLFSPDANAVKDELLKIANGELSLDGTYKRFFSAGQAWGQRSVLSGSNSL